LRIKKFLLEDVTVEILLIVYERGRVRHRDLALVVSSRGSLSNSLNTLLDNGLVVREIDEKFKPVRSFYRITEKGRKVAHHLKAAKELMAGSASQE
jgi:DNA-binding HxlR family transcriptional regulator